MSASAPGEPVAVRRPFVVSALAIAIGSGFGLGGALFAARAAGLPIGRWWPALAQAHGHAQIVGWAGLMVIGVGLHFLPRLRGTRLAAPGLVRPAWWALVAGLSLRTLSAALAEALPPPAVLAGLVAAAAFEVAGAFLIAVCLVRTLRTGPPIRERSGLLSTLPFFATGLIGWLAALIANLAGSIGSSLGALPAWADRLSVDLGLGAFLVPIAAAMSIRTFPLYLRTLPPRLPVARAGLASLIAGLGLRLAGGWTLAGAGALGLAAVTLFAYNLADSLAVRKGDLRDGPTRPSPSAL